MRHRIHKASAPTYTNQGRAWLKQGTRASSAADPGERPCIVPGRIIKLGLLAADRNHGLLCHGASNSLAKTSLVQFCAGGRAWQMTVKSGEIIFITSLLLSDITLIRGSNCDPSGGRRAQPDDQRICTLKPPPEKGMLAVRNYRLPSSMDGHSATHDCHSLRSE